MNVHIQKNIAQQQRAYIAKQRNRAILRLRLSNGIRELIRHPWKLAPLLTLVALWLIAWGNREKVVLTSSSPLLCTTWRYVVAILIVEFSAFSLFGLLVVLGTPHQARQTEAGLSHIALVDCLGFPPLLVSWQRNKQSKQIITLTFYSRGISRELWESKRRDVEDVLNVRWIEDVRYGGRRGDNGNYIVLTVASGAGTAGRGEMLYDDEL